MGAETYAENAQNDPLNVSPEVASILLKADLKNLAKKVQAGKTLSASERNVLQASLAGGRPSDKSFAKNQVELAQILGCERKTIQRARKIEGNPGVKPDGRYDVDAWRTFLNSRGTLKEDDGLSLSQLKARQILLQNQKLEEQLAILRREYVPAVEVEKWGAQLGSAIRKVITQLHLCAPQVVGVSVPEAEARLKEVEFEVLQQLHLLDDAQEKWRAAD